MSLRNKNIVENENGLKNIMTGESPEISTGAKLAETRRSLIARVERINEIFVPEWKIVDFFREKGKEAPRIFEKLDA